MKGTNIDSKIKLEIPKDRAGYLRLDLNECDWALDKNEIISFRKFSKFIVAGYVESEKILSRLSHYTRKPVNEILLTPGSERAIDLILRFLFKKGDKVMVPSPIFFPYYDYLNSIGTDIIAVPYEKENDKFVFPFESVINGLNKNVKGLILCNPTNPLGIATDEQQLKAIFQKTNKLKIPCIIDEAYYEFYGKTSAPLIDKYSNLIVIRTFSKTMGMAGLRFGYLLAKPHIIKKLLKLRGAKEMSHFSVFCATIALDYKSHYRTKLKQFQKTKKDLIYFFKSLKIKVYGTKTNFILIKVAKDRELMARLQKEHVLLKSIARYPYSYRMLRDCIRVTIPSEKALIAFKKKFKNIYKLL